MHGGGATALDTFLARRSEGQWVELMHPVGSAPALPGAWLEAGPPLGCRHMGSTLMGPLQK